MNTESTQGFWKGKASAMAAARKKARNQRKSNSATAESILASAHYSRAGTLRTRSRLWLPLILWHFWRARVHVRELIGYGITNLSPEKLDIMGTIFRKGPLPDIRGARLCCTMGIHAAKTRNTQPHTLALLHIGIGECAEQDGSASEAHQAFISATLLIPQIEKEEPDLHGKRQLVRVLRHCGAYFKRQDDPRGEKFLQRAETLAREVSSDQLAKIQAGV